MPSFVDALTDPEINRVVAFLRTFCSNRRWPRGDLNLPRAFVTEKAFPENETIVTTSVATSGPGAVENLLEFEHRIGARSQYEIAIPFSVLEQETGANKGGVGDITVAFKHVLFDNASLGKIGKEQRAGQFPEWQVSLVNPNFAEFARLSDQLEPRLQGV